MPSWKKVITSGSDAELNSLYAPSITGSLQGTASFAISSSYAISASYADNATSASYATTATLSERTTQTDILVLNQTGYTITKGMVVRITGSNTSSDIPRVVSASYENDNMSANTLGIALQNITTGNQGYVITEGILLGIDTTNYVSGQLLYLGPTGSITGSAPLAPLHSVRLGEVVRQQSNNGSVYVRIDNGQELGELHDVRDTTTTSSYGDLLVKSGSVWINSKQLTGSYGLTGSLIITGSTSGDLLRITQTGAGNAFIVEDSTNPDSTPFVIDASGSVAIGQTSSLSGIKLTVNGNTLLNNNYLCWTYDGVSNNDYIISNDSPHGGTGNTPGFYVFKHDRSLSFASGSGNSTLDAGSIWINESTQTNYIAGNVGIGISTPSAKLHVNNTGAGDSFLVEDSTNPDATPFIIDASGSVGIGTTTPAANYKLDIASAAGDFVRLRTTNSSSWNRIIYTKPTQQWSAGIDNNNRFVIGDETVSSYRIIFETGSAGNTIIPSGNVGIGTTTPAETLGITGTGMRLSELGGEASSIRQTSFHSTLYLASNLYYSGSTNPETNSYYILDSGSNNRGGNLLYLRTNGATGASPINGFYFYIAPTSSGANTLATLTEHFKIIPGTASFSSNIVGIGTALPTAKLHVNNTGADNSFLVEDSTNPDTTPFVIDNTGNVGIGTITPSHKLHIYNENPSSILVERSSSFNAHIQYKNVSGSMWAGVNNSGNFSIGNQVDLSTTGLLTIVSASGNVGIGTTTPNTKLDVSGSVLVTGSFDALSYSNKLIALTELSKSTLITHTIGTTNFTAINLNSDGTNRYAKTTFVAPLSGQVQVKMEFDMTIVNSAAVQMIGLHNTSSATSTPSEGWYRVNADNDSTSGQFYASFTKTGLTPGTTYTYYFMGVCDFSGNLVRASSVQTGSYAASSDLPSPLRIYTYDLGTTNILSNPST